MTPLLTQPDATTPLAGVLPTLTNQQKVSIATGEYPAPTGMVFALQAMGDTTNPDTLVPVLLDRPRGRGEEYYIVRIYRKYLTGIVKEGAGL